MSQIHNHVNKKQVPKAGGCAKGDSGKIRDWGHRGEPKKTGKTIETVKTGETWLARPANCKKNHNLQLWDVLLKHHPE